MERNDNFGQDLTIEGLFRNFGERKNETTILVELVDDLEIFPFSNCCVDITQFRGVLRVICLDSWEVLKNVSSVQFFLKLVTLKQDLQLIAHVSFW